MFEFQIVDSGNEIEPKSESFAPIPITLTKNAKDFKATENVLDQDTLARQSSIGRFLRIG